jgi:spore maturation protein CgeB
MRILLAWAAAPFSVRDVTTGLRGALLRAGHTVRDYRLDNRLRLMTNAFPKEMQESHEICRMATENVLAEASYHEADLVLITSGLSFHEVGLWLLAKHGIPTCVVLTESPYSDAAQQNWLRRYPDVTVFTQERTSAQDYGWHYLPAAYDVDVHQPVAPDSDEACDVLFVGTGWQERQQLFEAINWDGIHVRLRGLFPSITDASPLKKVYEEGCLANADLPRAYAACKIALNPYRQCDGAESMNPRAYELAACGVFQLSDYRAEANELFGASVPTYSSPQELERLIRYYLANPAERQAKADAARALVQGQTFDRRVADIISKVTARQAAA